MVISLNSSAIYLGSAGGSALGGLMLGFTPLTTLGWIGSGWELIALVVLLWSVWLIHRAVRQHDQPEHATEKVDEAQIVACVKGSDIA